jgi:hypothetical protein
MKPIQLISPVDGSVYAERTPLSPEAAKAAAARARAAQPAWAARPLADRIALVKAGVARLTAMKETIVAGTGAPDGPPDPLWPGRMGGVNARTDYMASIAAETLAPHIDRRQQRLPPLPGARGAWAWSSSSPLELPLPDHDQHPGSRADRGQYGDPETRQPDPAGGRAAGAGIPRRPGCRRMCSRTSCWTMPPPKA